MSVWIIRVASVVAISAMVTSASGKWHEGDAFYEQMASPLGASWSGAPLGDVVSGLSRTHNVAIVLDRRVDPGQAVSLDVFDRPLIDVLVEVAGSRNLGLYLHGPIVFLTPPAVAGRMEAVARARRKNVRRLPRAVARRWLAKSAMEWEELSTPAQLLSRLSKQGGFTVANPERLPHDLWAAGKLPKLSLADRVSFVLGQFGLTYEFSSDSTIKLVAIPAASVADRSEVVGNDAKLEVEKWKARTKKLRKTPYKGGKKEIRIEKFAVSEVKLEPLLGQLASRLGLSLELDREAIDSAGISLDRRVSVSLARVTPTELFEEILSPLGLQAKLRGTTVRIGPK